MHTRHYLLTSLTVMVTLLFMLSSLLQAELYEPFKKSDLTPPDEDEFQKMLENRVENHACMQKSKLRLQNLKAAQVFTDTDPTSNMYDYDVLYYRINVELDFDYYGVGGSVVTTFASLVDGLDRLEISMGYNLNVMDVVLNRSQSLTYNHTNDIITIYLPESMDSGEEAAVEIFYYGGVGAGGQGSMVYYYDLGTNVCFTSCEPFYSRFWWPCKDFPFDKPDSVDIYGTHPFDLTFVSNGMFQDLVYNGDGTSTTHWHEQYPIATYLITVGCADYTKYDQSWEYEPGQYMPIEQYYYPYAYYYDSYYSSYYCHNFTVPSLEALSYWYTLYPFIEERYGHNHFGWGGAMEHQTMTSISPYFDSEWVIAHEAAHQWGGDMVTCRDFHHMWLNEGFASYSECLYVKYHYGDEFWKDYLNSQKHLDASTPYVEDLVNDNPFDNNTVYDKGSWVFYMLHMILGEDGFREAMDSYLHDPLLEYKSAYTEDLQRNCETKPFC